MPSLRYTAAARDSLADIARYISRQSGSTAVARRFVDHLRQRCIDLTASPFQLGRPRPELGWDLRSFAVGNYVIFFRYIGDTLEVVDVVEGHRDIDAYFSRS
jgi:toxin ParE1/3/4